LVVAFSFSASRRSWGLPDAVLLRRSSSLPRKFTSTLPIELITAGEYLLALFVEDVLDHGVVLCGTQDESDCRVVVLTADFTVVVVDMHLHLPKVTVRELGRLDVDQEITLQFHVIEDQVGVVVVIIEGQAFLAGNESETGPQLEQEIGQPCYEC